MKRKVIAIDLDDVLADSASAFVEFSNKKWGTTLTVDDYTEHWAEMWGIDHDEMAKRAEHVYESKIQVDLKAIDEARDVLRYLALDYDLIIVTSRPLRLQAGTIEWLTEHYNGIFKDIHFAGIWDAGHHPDHANTLNKGGLVKKLGADYFIDDHPKHCTAVAKEGIPTLLFGDYEWNRKITNTDTILKVPTWSAVREYFDEQS